MGKLITLPVLRDSGTSFNPYNQSGQPSNFYYTTPITKTFVAQQISNVRAVPTDATLQTCIFDYYLDGFRETSTTVYVNQPSGTLITTLSAY